MENYTDTEGHPTTWEEMVQIIRENPTVSENCINDVILCDVVEGVEYTILDIAEQEDIEIEVMSE